MRPVYVVALVVACWLGIVSSSKPKQLSAFAAGATDIWQNMWPTTGQEGPLPITVKSPDGKRILTARFSEPGVLLEVRAGDLDSTISIGPGVQSAVEWSPDSKAFFVTTSDDGANGWYHALVYFVEKDGVKKVDPTPLVLAAFGHPVKCGWPEDPNVGAVTWLHGSDDILIAAEIVNHSNCDSFGTFKAYEVSLPDLRIVKTYGQIEAKKLFRNSLGSEIKDAPDKCIRDPKSCWVTANHESHQ